jgi:hypothetical protein
VDVGGQGDRLDAGLVEPCGHLRGQLLGVATDGVDEQEDAAISGLVR